MTEHLLTPHSVSTPLQRFAVRALTLFGWQVNFAPLPGPRGVVIVYPHTSNWDVVVGILVRLAMGVPFRWLGKHTLFRGICGLTLGPLLRASGGEPIERSTSNGAIERLAKRIKSADYFWLVLAPEGTRKYRDNWRSGFYHIALTAGVPLGMATIDYRNKQARLVDYAVMTGDRETDLACIRNAYRQCHGLNPECAAPIEFATTERRADKRLEESAEVQS